MSQYTSQQDTPEPGTEMVIRNRVAELRRKNGLSRKELADRVGINHRTVGKLERQEHSPSPDLALAWRMDDLFEVPLEEVFYRRPAQEPTPDEER
ncbi:MAG: helix-turn-helix domain-containing protein [Acidobacteria bacterium]|nr:helix-turn-helix domain-containing protein [Acidobacteriota bacterium]